MNNNWSKISSDISRRHLIEEYVRDSLSKAGTPIVFQNKSIDNVMKAVTRGKLTDSDFIMDNDKLLEIKNVFLEGDELKITTRKQSTKSLESNNSNHESDN